MQIYLLLSYFNWTNFTDITLYNFIEAPSQFCIHILSEVNIIEFKLDPFSVFLGGLRHRSWVRTSAHFFTIANVHIFGDLCPYEKSTCNLRVSHMWVTCGQILFKLLCFHHKTTKPWL